MRWLAIVACLAWIPTTFSRFEPFPTKELVPYETCHVSGWNVEAYQVPLSIGELGKSGLLEVAERRHQERKTLAVATRQLSTLA